MWVDVPVARKIVISSAFILLTQHRFGGIPESTLLAGEKPATRKSEASRPLEDIGISWIPEWFDNDDDPRQEQDVVFYINGRIAGFNKEGFAAILDRVRKLLAGASVVWHTNPDLFVAGSGSERVVPQTLYPALWKEFLRISQQRKVAVSSVLFCHPLDAPVRESPLDRYDVEYVEPGTKPRSGESVVTSVRAQQGGWPVYAVDGRETGRNRQGFLDTLVKLRDLPDGARLRFKIIDEASEVAHHGWDFSGPNYFSLEFADLLREKKFRLAVEAAKENWPEYANRPACCRWEWRNFRNAYTPHSQVVYLFEGDLVGIGDAGFDAVLARLQKLPAGSYIEFPRYYIHPKVHIENHEAFLKKDLVPFAQRRRELEAVIRRRQLVVERNRVLFWPKPHDDGRVDTDHAESEYLRSLLKFATIIRDGRVAAKADAIVTWKRDQPKENKDAPPATFFVDGEATGIGTAGFLAALRRLEQLPDGAMVRLNPICIRTKGPFNNALVYGGRHFELTRDEDPFVGVIDLLGDLARRKKFRVEAIPSEGQKRVRPNA